jgi:anti-sigma-K factor RskA
MPSEHLQLLIAGYVLGDLDPDEATELERLMREDPAIAQEVARMQKALEVAYAPPEVNPPAHLRAAILSAGAVQTNPQSRIRPRRARSFSWSKAMNIAAAALIVALGINNYRLWRTLQATETEVQRLATLNYSLQAAAGENRGSAMLEVDPNRLEAALRVSGLPPLPAGKVYALWTVVEPNAPVTTDSKGAILINAFDVDPQGNTVQQIAVPPVFRNQEFVSKVAITIEDADAPQMHIGSPILITGLQ